VTRRLLVGAAALLVVAAAVVAAIELTRPGPSSRGPPSGPSSRGPRSASRPAAPLIGVSVNRLFNDLSYRPDQIDAQLAALAATGATAARTDALWGATEPFPPSSAAARYDWRFDDAIAGSLAAHRITWLPIVDYSPPWAESRPGHPHSPPTSDGAYAGYAAALAARYDAAGSFWRTYPSLPAEPVDTFEIWNEPDNPGFWNPTPDPARYARLYLAARAAIRRADPAAHVIVGGLTTPKTFLPALIRAAPALRTEIDGVAIHPYAPDPAGVLARVGAARNVLRSLGLSGVPLYVTEFGWTTSPPRAPYHASEQLRPGYIAQTIDALAGNRCRIAEVYLYTWVTPERDPANAQDWYGIHPPAGGDSPDTAAFARALGDAAEKPVSCS
jgi:hypothetical protein